METSPLRIRGVNWLNRFTLSAVLLALCVWCIAPIGVFAQGAAAGSESGRGQEEKRPASPTQGNRGVRPSPDIVTDNPDRVAATAKQILELLNKDAGLMVEFKSLLAQDAGAAGQIVDEADLTDLAVSERLNEDLRARVLATRLLQRYGYLLPKVNPDSDLGAEHALVLQHRAYAIAHADERDADSRASFPLTQTSGCGPERSSDCDFPARPSNRTFMRADGEGQQGPPAEPAIPYQSYPGAPSHTDSPQSPPSLSLDPDLPRRFAEFADPSVPPWVSDASSVSPVSDAERSARSSRGERSTAPSLAQPDNSLGSLGPRTDRNYAERRSSNGAASELVAASFVSSRQGCESCEVKVLVPPIACSRADSMSDAREGNDARFARM